MSLTTNNRSFSQRAAAMGAAVESWDDDGDFQGDLLTQSVVSNAPSLSSRFSNKSESVIGDDADWHILVAPDDESSTSNAISSAKQAGIPIPSNVPSSALLGGSIKRLGKKKSHQKIDPDDWGNDLELPPSEQGSLKLRSMQPRTPATDQDEFDDWGEGSLGIRFAGTRRSDRNRSSSVSAMSPSMGSCMTLESEDDELNGLVLPSAPVDFSARLSKLKEGERSVSNAASAPPQPGNEMQPTVTPAAKSSGDDDFFADIEFESTKVLDNKRARVNRNLKIQSNEPKPKVLRTSTSLTFTERASTSTSSKIPRPLPASKSSRLDPVYESGASRDARGRHGPTTTNSQLLRAKRSAPVLRSTHHHSKQPPMPAGPSNSHTLHAKSATHQPRRDSDPYRAPSPYLRSHSRMSSTQPPDTPSRSGNRRDMAPAALAREAAAQRMFTRPTRRRQYGDGNELESFDDLPTSATKESKYVKQPSGRGAPKTLRHTQSNNRLPMPDRVASGTPLPHTPRSPTKVESTPRFARDTQASRIAREARLREAGTRSRAEGPVPAVQTNWKAQVAARSPQNSPNAHRKKGTGQKPQLIKAMGSTTVKNQKGMIYNPELHRWEGNDGALTPFNHPNQSSSTLASVNLTTSTSTPTFAPKEHAASQSYHQHSRSNPSDPHPVLQPTPSSSHTRSNAPSPPRAPALISHISSSRGVQVERGMVFDPQRMRWLKLAPNSRNGSSAADPLSPSIDDEDDPFAGFEDLKDETSNVAPGSGSVGGGTPSAGASGSAFGGTPGGVDEGAFVGEEFDLGPGFIRRQGEEEAVWRRRVEGWIAPPSQQHPQSSSSFSREGEWRWIVRDLARVAEQGLRW